MMIRGDGLFAWCAVCHKFRQADIGPDPLVEGRITEILRTHRGRWWHLRKCAGSGQDADPVAVQ